MFLWQRFGYNYRHLRTREDITYMLDVVSKITEKIGVFDTETTGLHQIADKPFLLGFGVGRHLFTLDVANKEGIDALYEAMRLPKLTYLFAHNAKYDYHMMLNIDKPIPDDLNYADSLALARLTDYADSSDGIGLGALGPKLVHPDAKFASKVIKEHIKSIKAQRLREAKAALKERLNTRQIGKVWAAYLARVPFVKTEYDEIFDWLDTIYQAPTYEDSYKEKPDLMLNYLADDLVINLRVVDKLMPILAVVDEGLRTFTRENKLIKVVAAMERHGFNIDIPYLLKAREDVIEYRDKLYDELAETVGVRLTANQHARWKRVFAEKYKIGTDNMDDNVLAEIEETYEGEPAEVARTIRSLRTLDKWLNTYIEGMLKRVHNGRVYTTINNSGTVTGRVSSDMQQQPKEPLKDRTGKTLFHPRQAFVTDPGGNVYYFDYKNMELRVQALYTLLVCNGDGDLNLCRAFIPYKYTSLITGKEYDIDEDYANWDSGEWVDEDLNPWEPVDVHTASTLQAFPDKSVDDADFAHYRSLGKRANFAKNYGSGAKTIADSLRISEELATAFSDGYYKAFPKIRDYQRYVESSIYTKGYLENLMGRRYYIQESGNSYKGYNYGIQGFGADLLKIKEVEIDDFLRRNSYDSKLLMVVHDEVQMFIPDHEKHIVPEIKRILEDCREYSRYIPMTCDIEYTSTNWAHKEEYDE